ncbi:cytochrome c-type biogenesis protein [Variovorax saccharolyticus]|uniref:cytochrome c-type biogenesis protein n=1 Tax=Variovorax saccharolyticus TaxID=3053516 RepID=UPI00257820C8|nr:cytochrome c-type biogenesis protein [Variovorax sp. J31P216]MDM0029760.1 cytochrome c-type biogenesis protein CcmH [Variovorax sp. J31P216]
MRGSAKARTGAWAIVLCAAMQGAAAAAASIEEREAQLAASLRCMVCQNQTLAESNAPLAVDMRRQIREQLGQGRSERQIQDYFEQRYGAFVRYDPPFMPSTWLLWLGPFVLLAVGFAALWRAVSRHGRAQPVPLTPAEREQAAALLKEDPR